MAGSAVKTKTKRKTTKKVASKNWTSESLKSEVLEDFRICCLSREASILARKEVLMGKANFGIIGDGKEVVQVAMARAWKKGDFRTGYYRDQTLMMALGLMTLEQFFAQLYGDPQQDDLSSGRQMNGHFQTSFLDENGKQLDLKNRFNVAADISPTAGQMARGLGLALASKKFRENPEICGDQSNNGNEVVFTTIGDASTSEGPFWETVNAATVMQVPMAINVWDDGYGISVPKKYQTAKESISDILAGFQPDHREGMAIHIGKGWDYPNLRKLYEENVPTIREKHQPALFHIEEITQQLGHSTSGDHRRYKSPERLQYELDYDCNKRMADWMVAEGICTEEDIKAIQKEAKSEVKNIARKVYDGYQSSVKSKRDELLSVLEKINQSIDNQALNSVISAFQVDRTPLRYTLIKTARKAKAVLLGSGIDLTDLETFIQYEHELGAHWYSSHLMDEGAGSALKVEVVKPLFGDENLKDGYEILNACFDYHLENKPEFFAFGEDVGKIGDVNQAFRGMQEKYGKSRVFDAGIREWTIMGQAIGMSMRGLRPIAEIQYLDYLLYGISPLSDDLATLRWRTFNQQQAPAIIRTRGHRLVGVWHSGSPMGMMLGSLRGLHICVPRNMTQAAGMYNTLLQSTDPAIVVECLNGYRLKEALPENIGEFTVPLGAVEVLQEGTDITIITYGSSVRIAQEAMDILSGNGVSVELIDIQTLLPFDITHRCVESLKKTNRVLFLDEDVPGGASAYMMQEVLENQNGYRYLDSKPLTLAAKPHRPAYGQDGDYFSKPQAEDVVEVVIATLQEAEPNRF